MAVAYWVESMSKDIEVAKAEAKQTALEQITIIYLMQEAML